jgi:putative transposase
MSDRLSYKPYYHRNLPHIQPPGATFFITFRLYGSLPLEVLRRWKEEAEAYERLLATLPQAEIEIKRHEEHKRFFGRYDSELDRAEFGPQWLREPAVATIVFDALKGKNGQEYDLEAFTIMSYHVHVVLTPLPIENNGYTPLASILHGIKRSTAWYANSALGRKGSFWQHESYDHFVRNERELERIVNYVKYNPVKAKLVEDWEAWPWTYWKYVS